MLEFIRKEVWCMEEAEVSRASLLSFFLNGHREDTVVLSNRGIFRKYVTYEGLLYDIPGNGCSVTAGENIFREAKLFFADKANRLRLLPVVDGSGNLFSFLRWNNQRREIGQPDQKPEEIEKAPRLFLRECNESIYLWLREFLKEHTEKEIILEGEGWEVLTACQAVIGSENKIALNTRGGVCDALELTFGKIPRFMLNTVKSMWELKEDYLGCRIFVWLENRQGVALGMRLMLSGIHVEGFCREGQKEVTAFWGKPVCSLEKLADQPDILIVYWNEEEGVKIKEKVSHMQSLCLPHRTLFQLRREIREGKNVIFYDSRQEAEKVAALLEKHDTVVWGNCAVEENQKPIALGRNICRKELMGQVQDYNVILASGRTYYERSLEALDNRNIDIFVPERDILYKAEQPMLMGNPGWYLDRAIANHKKIILYGAESCFTNALLMFFHTMDIKIEAILDDSAGEKENIDSVYELAYGNPEEFFIIVNKKIDEFIKSCEMLDSLGYNKFHKNYIGLYDSAYRHLPEKKDITLGYVTEMLLNNEKYPGFRVYGEDKPGDYRIVTLGGSTTTAEGYRTPCWPQLLHQKFLQEGKKATVYNGGVDGYDAGNELYKLIRDVRNLHPHLIISFSGINNILREEYPYVPKHLDSVFGAIFQEGYCRGLKEDAMSAAQIWAQQEQMMYAVSTYVYRAKFVCFAQPTYISKNVLSFEERLKHELDVGYRESGLAFRKEVSKLVEQYEWMVDIQDMLDDNPEVFMDCAHVYEEGNWMIADAVYAHIIGEFEEEGNDKDI